jgi:hypothetical protein
MSFEATSPAQQVCPRLQTEAGEKNHEWGPFAELIQGLSWDMSLRAQ